MAEFEDWTFVASDSDDDCNRIDVHGGTFHGGYVSELRRGPNNSKHILLRLTSQVQSTEPSALFDITSHVTRSYRFASLLRYQIRETLVWQQSGVHDRIRAMIYYSPRRDTCDFGLCTLL